MSRRTVLRGTQVGRCENFAWCQTRIPIWIRWYGCDTVKLQNGTEFAANFGNELMPNCQPLLRDGLAEIRPKVRSAPNLSLFLDFDGTLAQLVDDPAEARLGEPMRELLLVLAKRADVLTSIISGRALSDLQTRVGVSDIVYAGNHGLEISGKGLRFFEPFAAARQELLSRISACLTESLRNIPGVKVEYKGLTTSIHHRLAPPAAKPDIERIVSTVVAPGVSPFCLNAGKMVFEIVPRANWNKGAAVCWINSRLAPPGAASIYIGDDCTDETAFRQLSDEITVCVGKPASTSARFCVKDPDAVQDFLSWLIENRQQRAAAAALDDSNES